MQAYTVEQVAMLHISRDKAYGGGLLEVVNYLVAHRLALAGVVGPAQDAADEAGDLLHLRFAHAGGGHRDVS